MVKFHPHAKERLLERGASEEEVAVTVESGETFPVKFGRTGFRRNFPFDGIWRGKNYKTKQVEVFAVKEEDYWIAITVITRYY